MVMDTGIDGPTTNDTECAEPIVLWRCRIWRGRRWALLMDGGKVALPRRIDRSQIR